MGNKRVPDVVQAAINHARTANWDVSIRNEKIGITAPDGVKLTVGISPNDESLKQFVREASKYQLVNGPAMTPKQQEDQLKEMEEEGLKEAARRNEQRKAFEAQQAKKAEEARAAAEKAKAATANGLKKVKPEYDKDGFPAFDSALLGSTDYPKFKLPSGRFYCVECLSEGVKADFKAPQGLATHRGFRHQMYLGEGGAIVHAVTPEAVVAPALPEEIRTAFELLQIAVAEHVGTGDDSERVKGLEETITLLRKQAEADLSQADKQYNEAKETFEKALRVEKEKVHSLTKELHGKDGVHQAEITALMKGFRELLEQVQKTIENERPIQAVAQIDELLTGYLSGS